LIEGFEKMGFLLALFSPFKLWLGGAAIILLIVGGIYTYGRSAGKSAVIEKIQRENERMAEQAGRARREIEQKFDAGEVLDDGFKRQ
jgi:hypothetical protein